MSKGFSIDDVLGDQSKVTRPAGSRMDIVMLPIGDIVENPENAIYEIGDVSGLQDNIAKYGLRTPLEVTPAGGKYMLVAGHRRHTACLGLHNGGDDRFDRLPCIIVNYDSRDEEVVALITSNATARELTDIEKIRQYEALKDALSRMKEAGKLSGRVRDAIADILGKGTGTINRLNMVSTRCVPEVKEMLARGEISMNRAIECSKLYKVQQVMYAKNGYSSMPRFTPKQKAWIIEALVRGALKDFLSGLRYFGKNQWDYATGEMGLLPEPVTCSDNEWMVRVEQKHANYFECFLLDPAAKEVVYLGDMFKLAKKLYQTDQDKEKEKTLSFRKQDTENARKKEQERWYKAALEEMHRFDEWKKVAQAKELGLVFREYVFIDGGRMVVAVDEESRQKVETGLPYDYYFGVRFGADGTRVHRESGEKTNIKFFTKWDWKPELALRIAEDLRARARAESD